MLTGKDLGALIIYKSREKASDEAAHATGFLCIREKAMRIIILLAGVMFMVTVAHAEIYQWTDRDGEAHFTDNVDKIPLNYRSKARKMDLEPVIQIKETPAEAIAQSKENSPSTYGGHDEMWWRSSYRKLREEMKNIQDNLPKKRDDLAELRRKKIIFSKPSGRIAYYDMLKGIERDEARVTELQNQLAELDAKAAKAGVPLGWRQ